MKVEVKTIKGGITNIPKNTNDIGIAFKIKNSILQSDIDTLANSARKQVGMHHKYMKHIGTTIYHKKHSKYNFMVCYFNEELPVNMVHDLDGKTIEVKTIKI